MSEPIEIRISGGANATARVNAGAAVCGAVAGRVTFAAEQPTGWDGDEWVIRCEADDVAAVSALAVLDGFTVAVGGVVVSAPEPVAACFMCGPVDTFTPEPPKKGQKVRRRATPG